MLKKRRNPPVPPEEEFAKHVEGLKDYEWCGNCRHCQHIGNGDHICRAFTGCTPLILRKYKPTSAYMGCNGRMWDK